MDLLVTAEELLGTVKSYLQASSDKGVQFRRREDIRALSLQLVCHLDGPEQAMHTVARQYTVCTALKICADLELAAKVPEDKPTSLEELSHASRCDARVIRPLLRLLAQNGIFSQNPEGLWRHTPMSRVINQAPFRAWLNSILGEKYQSTAHLPTFLSQRNYTMPRTGDAAYNSLYKTPLDFYTYANELDHAASDNFAVSMQELSRTHLPFIYECYRFIGLPPRSRFIDIAGGEGNLSFFLAQRLPYATFELQDHSTVIAQAKRSCNQELRSRIDFRAHDMFLPQPPIDREVHTDGVVLMLKIILHDHDDEQCRRILTHVISAMIKGDRLLIMETVLPEVGGSLSSSMSDVIILSMFGCGHRTLKEWMALIGSCGEVQIRTYSQSAAEFDGMMVFEVCLSDGFQ